MKQDKQVVDQFALFRKEATPHFRLAEAYQHGEQFEAIGVRVLLVRAVTRVSLHHAHLLGQWCGLGGRGHFAASHLPLLLHADHLGVHGLDDVETHLFWGRGCRKEAMEGKRAWKPAEVQLIWWLKYEDVFANIAKGYEKPHACLKC